MAFITKPNALVNGQVAQGSDVDNDFNVIYADYNGNITNANIAANAAIVDTKLNQIATAGKVNGTALTNLAGITSASGIIPAANISAMQYTDTRTKVGMFTRDMQATSGNVAYTGVGFRPKAIQFIGGLSTQSISNGVADATNSYGNQLSAAVSYSFTNGFCVFISNMSGDQRGAINSMDADGFTIAWTKTSSPDPGTASIAYIAFR